MSKQEFALAGDILFYRISKYSGWRAKSIGLWEKIFGKSEGTYSHVSILDKTLTLQYESTLPKVKASTIDWDNCDIDVYRIKGAKAIQLSAMLNEAKTHFGEWYGLGKSIKSLLRTKRLEICTHYVVDSAIIGTMIDLTNGSGDMFISPDELSKSTCIYKVV